jgi:hypothetical protein
MTIQNDLSYYRLIMFISEILPGRYSYFIENSVRFEKDSTESNLYLYKGKLSIYHHVPFRCFTCVQNTRIAKLKRCDVY